MAEEARPLRDPLADLRERLEATRDAAEQFAGEAADAARAEREGEDPGPGWRTAEEREALRDDAASLASTLATLSELIPAGAARTARRGAAPAPAARPGADRLDRRAPAADPRRRAGGRGHPGPVGRIRSPSARTLRAMAAEHPTTWILTGSPENFETTREHGFTIIGMKERRRLQALSMEPGDRIVFYLTKIGKFGGSVRITSEMFEDREPLWPGKPGSPDPYPWRFHTEPELILDDDDLLSAEDVKDDLEHIRKWPARPLEARLPGPAANGVGRGRRPAPGADARGGRRQGMSPAPGEGDVTRVQRRSAARRRVGAPSRRTRGSRARGMAGALQRAATRGASPRSA